MLPYSVNALGVKYIYLIIHSTNIYKSVRKLFI